MNIKKQLQSFYAFEALLSFRITDAVWVLFLIGRGYNLAQVGIAEGVFHITSMICEVPSGMLADLLGRKRTLIFAAIAGVVSSLFMGFGDHIIFIFVGMLFSGIAISMASGTEEAIVYDSLLEAEQEEQYRKIRVRISIISRVCSTMSCLFTPVAIFLGYQKLYLLSAAICILQMICLLCMKEPVTTKQQKRRQQKAYVQLRERWRLHVRTTGIFIKNHPQTMCKLLASAAIASPCYLTLMYLQEHLVACGWPESWIGIPILVIPLGGVVGAWLASKRQISLWKTTLICGIAGGVGTIFAGNGILLVAIVGAMVARICEGNFEIHVSEETNREFPSDQRATLISVDGMLYSLVMIVLSPITGFIGDYYNIQLLFGFLGGSLVLATIVGLFIYRKKQCRIQ